MSGGARPHPRARGGLAALAGALLVAAAPSSASAEESTQASPSEARTAERARLAARLEAEPGATIRVFASAATGFGLRFNNPYRLESQVGADAASLSLTAPYLDFAASVVGGPAYGLQHGGGLHIGTSVSGVMQPYLTPSYVLAYRADLPLLVYGRLATPLLLSPDVNIGAEIAGSLSYFFNGGLGLTSEIAFDLFYGAATLEAQYSVIPILSFQLGVIADYELLP
ncbi:MAG: hypothetical protein IPG04_20335 [Polyangiaceae bacterium]|nr:hypothetical protein [Polyangiaceae bacterium]